jgi:putative ABC transport system permease protein
MNYIQINLSDLGIALVLILISLFLSYRERVGLGKSIIIGTIRAFIQLIAIGYILKLIFDLSKWYWVLLMLAVMITVAGFDAVRRQDKKVPHNFAIVIISITLGALLTLATVTGLILRVQPWYQPQYVIPIAGMIIGNSMNGASLAINRLVAEIRLRRTEIEAALSLGATARQAVNQAFKEAVKSAMIPTINAMMIVGIVQLPGMMTGQIIAGTRPEQAVRYQVVVVYMITAAVTITCICAGLLTYRQYFTKSHQLKNELL